MRLVRYGHIKKTDCIICGDSRVSAHHYGNGLEKCRNKIWWLCKAHHTIADRHPDWEPSLIMMNSKKHRGQLQFGITLAPVNGDCPRPLMMKMDEGFKHGRFGKHGRLHGDIRCKAGYIIIRKERNRMKSIEVAPATVATEYIIERLSNDKLVMLDAVNKLNWSRPRIRSRALTISKRLKMDLVATERGVYVLEHRVVGASQKEGSK